MPTVDRNISGNGISSIDTPGANKYIWSVIDTTSNVLSDTNNVEKFDTSVQSSTNQERNLKSLRIEDEILRSILTELGTELDPSVRVNLTNSIVHKSPKFKSLGHPIIKTSDIRNLEYISAARPKNCNGLRRSTDRDDRLGYTHYFETMSRTTAYCNLIKNL